MKEKVDRPDQLLPVEKLLEIDGICQQFEAAWKSGQEPKVEDFLGHTPEPERSELRRELSAIEAEYRRALQDTAVTADFHPVAPPPAKHKPAPAPKLPATVQPDNSSKPAGAELGDIRGYRLLEKLGEGGMGVVYKALHIKLDKLVALKVLPPRGTDDPKRVAQFEQEMKAVGRLEDPHLVRAMDAGQVGNRHYLVMEYVDGLDLSEVLAQAGQLRIADACETARQAALGLKAVDERGLVHRDIKPSNLILNDQGQVKILDLGLALFAAEKVLEGGAEIAGTPDYIAPEQIAGGSELDIRADLYSLGCTLYKLLTGRAPFSGQKYPTSREKFRAHVEEQAPAVQSLRGEVPAKLAAMVDRLLAKDRDLRLPSPDHLAESLRPFCAGADLAGLYARLAAVRRPRQADDASRAMVQTHVPPSPTPAKPSRPASRPVATEEPFDPYYKWLGIPPEQQPANNYRLLGIQVFEADRDVIQSAVARQAAHLRTFALGPHAAMSQRLLNEVHAAKICLLVPEKKAAYDAQLRRQLEQAAPGRQPTLASQAPAEARGRSGPGASTAATSQGATGGLPTRASDGTGRQAASGTQSPLSDSFFHRPVALAKRLIAPSRTLLKRFSKSQKIAIAAAVGLGFLAVLLGIILKMHTAEGTLVVEIDEPDATVQVLSAEGNLQIERKGQKGMLTIGVDPGKHRLRVEKEGFVVFVKDFAIASGGREVIKAKLEPAVAKAEGGGRKAEADKQQTAASNKSPLPPGEGRGKRTPPLAVAPFDEKKAKEHQQVWAKHLGVRVEMSNSIGMKLVLIPPGTFDIGSSRAEIDQLLKEAKAEQLPQGYVERIATEGPRHRVTISRPFYLGVYEVTQAEYQQVMGDNPSRFSSIGQEKGKLGKKDTGRFPVEYLNYPDAERFCRKLAERPEEQAAGRKYRLPTEAEWECACRAGTATRYYFGDDESKLGEYAWYRLGSRNTTHSVGEKKHNAWGLYDMLGNVWEWCADWYGGDYYQQSPADDPTGPASGSSRVMRGGGWSNDGSCCRPAYRHFIPAPRNDFVVGFRVVCEIKSNSVSSAPPTPGATGGLSTRASDGTGGQPAAASQTPGPTTAQGVVPGSTSGTAESTGTQPTAASPIPNLQSPIPPPAVAPFDTAKAKEEQQAWSKKLGLPAKQTNSAGIRFALIPPASVQTLQRGQLRIVDIVEPFYLGLFEVTQEQYQKVMGSNPSNFSAAGKKQSRVAGMDTRSLPVARVSWLEAAEFCNRLSRAEGLPPYYRIEKNKGSVTGARSYCLPSRAAWLCAAFGGQPIPQMDGPGWDAYAWYSANSDMMPHPVGQKKPTAFGLYDMVGNVGEFCGRPGSHRGWSFGSLGDFLSKGTVFPGGPTYSRDITGFRVARILPQERLSAAGLPELPPRESAAAERKAAEWVLAVGGRLRIVLDHEELDVTTREELPPVRWQVAYVDLRRAEVTDEGLKNLAGLHALCELCCGTDQVTEAGLASIAGLKSLERLELTGGTLTDQGLACLARLTGLRYLTVNRSKQVTDAGLEPLRLLKSLEHLELAMAPLSDQGVAHVAALPRLRYLQLSHNKVTDAGLKQLTTLTRLEVLICARTQITDAGLEELKRLKGLRDLRLGGNARVTDAGLEHLGEMTGLEVLQLGGNKQLTDRGIAHLQSLTNLRVLNLDGTRLSDRGLENLKPLRGLRLLSLQNTKVTDPGMERLAALTALEHLDLSGTVATDAAITPLKRLPNLRWLDLRRTKVTAAGVIDFLTARPKCKVLVDESVQAELDRRGYRAAPAAPEEMEDPEGMEEEDWRPDEPSDTDPDTTVPPD